jgi:hypothetical protein
MAAEGRVILKTYFETGDIPTEEQFANLIDSYLSLTDDDYTDVPGLETQLDDKVPYNGAIDNVDLGLFSITANNGVFVGSISVVNNVLIDQGDNSSNPRITFDHDDIIANYIETNRVDNGMDFIIAGNNRLALNTTEATIGYNLAVSGNTSITGIVTANAFRSNAGNTDFSSIVRDSAGWALYVQNANTGGAITQFRYGSETAGEGTLVVSIDLNGITINNGKLSTDTIDDDGAGSLSIITDVGITGVLTVNGEITDATPLAITRNSGNVSMSFANDVEVIYIGLNDNDVFAIKDSAALNSSPVFTVDPTTGDTNIAGDLTVDTDTLYVDSTNGYVGIGTNNPLVELDVDGSIVADGIGAVLLSITGDGLIEGTLSVDTIDDNSAGVITVTQKMLIDSSIEIDQAGAFSYITNTVNSGTMFLRVKDSGGTSRNAITASYTSGTTLLFQGTSKLNTTSTGVTISNKLTVGEIAGLGLGVTISDDLIIDSSAPASATATGATGTITYDSNYIYVCTATDTWKRAALSTW